MREEKRKDTSREKKSYPKVQNSQWASSYHTSEDPDIEEAGLSVGLK
jgi:hypothetical protein